MRFQGRTVVVTGGASGIGLAAVRRFHAEGASVVIADLNDAAGETLARELGERSLYRSCDVADWSQVESLMNQAVESFGGLDVVFNNAGIGSFAGTADLTPEAWRRVIEVDLDGVFYGCKAALPHFRARGGGAVVNTASISGMHADYGFAAYNAAKAAVINYTRAFAIDHARENIRCNAICPGPVDTPIIAGINELQGVRQAWDEVVPMGRFARPEEIAAVACFLASDDASFITGAMIPVDGGVTAHTGQPNLVRMLGLGA